MNWKSICWLYYGATACTSSARVPISMHCKILAYYNGLTRVHRLRRLEKICVHS